MKVLLVGKAMIELSMSEDGRSPSIGVAGDVLKTVAYLRRAAVMVAAL